MVYLALRKVVHQHAKQSRDMQWFAPSCGRCKLNSQSDGTDERFPVDRDVLSQGRFVSFEQRNRASLKSQ